MIKKPVKELVYKYISEASLTTAHYARLYDFAVRGAVDIGLDISQPPVTERLAVSANKTVAFPVGMAQWLKIGVLNENGEVSTILRNTSLTTYASTDPDRLSMNTDNTGHDSLGNVFTDYYVNFYQQGSLFTLFGAGYTMDYAGEFRVDEANNLILLGNDFPHDYVIVEYIKSPEAEAIIAVPLQAQEALIAFLRWMDILSIPSGRRSNLGEKQIRRKEYYNQRRLARERIKLVRKHEFNDAIRLTNTLAQK